MHTRSFSAAIILAACGLAASPAAAGIDVPITTAVYSGQIFAQGGFTSISPFVSYAHPQLANPPGFMGNQNLTGAHFVNGTILELTGDFPGFAGQATNGVAQQLWIGFGAPLAEPVFDFREESAVFTGINVTPPDLAGWNLTRITIMGTALQLTNLGAGTLVTATVEFTFWGFPIPAPSAAAVLGLGALAATRRRR